MADYLKIYVGHSVSRAASGTWTTKRAQGLGYDIGADEYLDTNGQGLPDWWQLKYFGGFGVSPTSGGFLTVFPPPPNPSSASVSPVSMPALSPSKLPSSSKPTPLAALPQKPDLPPLPAEKGRKYLHCPSGRQRNLTPFGLVPENIAELKLWMRGRHPKIRAHRVGEDDDRIKFGRKRLAHPVQENGFAQAVIAPNQAAGTISNTVPACFAQNNARSIPSRWPDGNKPPGSGPL